MRADYRTYIQFISDSPNSVPPNTSVFPFVETCPACWNNYKVAA